MSNSPPENFKHLERSPQYHLNGGDLYLLAGTVLFRVHSHFFERDSTEFRDMLKSPVACNQPRPGSTESSPIVIKNSSPSEFSKFLWVFYNPTYSIYNASASEWIDILKIACGYNFVEVKHLAIRGLEQCDTLSIVQRIKIYQLYKADAMYLVPLFVKMCIRDEGPTDEETEELGTKTSLMIFRARERLRSHAGDGNKSPLPAGVDEGDAVRTICGFLGVDSYNTASASLPNGDKKGKRRSASQSRGQNGDPGYNTHKTGKSRQPNP